MVRGQIRKGTATLAKMNRLPNNLEVIPTSILLGESFDCDGIWKISNVDFGSVSAVVVFIVDVVDVAVKEVGIDIDIVGIGVAVVPSAVGNGLGPGSSAHGVEILKHEAAVTLGPQVWNQDEISNNQRGP